MLLSVLQAELSFGSRRLFSDVSFSIYPGDRIALVGSNGSGKSSLVSALLGQVELDKGSVTRKRNLKIGVLPQQLADRDLRQTPRQLVERRLAGSSGHTAVLASAVLDELELLDAQRERPLDELSGGWQRLVALRALLCSGSDLYILDEPSNFLDFRKLSILEDLIEREADTGFLIIDHDREFLDNVCRKTMVLRTDALRVFAADYSVARRELAQADSLQSRRRDREEAEIKRIEASSRRLRVWSNLKGINPDLARRSKAMQSRADQLRESQTKAPPKSTRRIDLSPGELRPEVLVRMLDVPVATPDGRGLFNTGKVAIRKGERITVLGRNGTGKSTLLDLLVNTASGQGGNDGPLRVNPQVRIGYLDQELSVLPENAHLDTFLRERFRLTETEAVRRIRDIGIDYNGAHKKIGSLSFGERTRLALLYLRLTEANLLVLDEPTNHLDIEGREQLEDVLASESMTCIFTSHDRRMLRQVPSRWLEIRGKTLVEVDGADEFIEQESAGKQVDISFARK